MDMIRYLSFKGIVSFWLSIIFLGSFIEFLIVNSLTETLYICASFESVSHSDELWRTIERIEETNEGFLLVLNASDIPLGIIDRSKIGNFVLNKLGFN